MMSKFVSSAFALLALSLAGESLSARAAPPSTDIFLAPIRMQHGKPVVGRPVNVTSRPGYDNQPSFTPDSRSMLFPSVSDDAQAAIHRYDLRTPEPSTAT